MSEENRNQDNLDEQAGGQRGGLLGDLFDEALGQSGDFGDVLQSFLGEGDSTSEESDKAEPGFLDGLLGGALEQFLPSVADDVLRDLGLSPETAQTVMAFVATKAISGKDKDGPADAQRLSLGNLLEVLGDDEESDEPSSLAVGWAKELAAKTDLDADTALEAIQMVILVLGGESVASAKRKVKRRNKQPSSSKPKRKSTKSTNSRKKTSSTAKKKTTTPRKKASSTAKKKTSTPRKKASSTAKKKTSTPRKKASSTAKKKTTSSRKKTASTAKKKSTSSRRKTSS